MREIPMEHGRLIMTPEEVLKRCDENTIGVVPTLGVTFTCQYEPVKAVADALDQLEKDKGLDIRMHVDGASGGFLAPFCAPDLVWDFRIPRVKSINTSGHKFGLSPLGVGWVIWREEQDLAGRGDLLGELLGRQHARHRAELLTTGRADCLSILQLPPPGKEGYRKIHTACYDTAKYIAGEIEKLGPFEIIYDGEMDAGIPALCWKMKMALTRDSASTTWQIGCAAAVGKCPPIRCLPIARIFDSADSGSSRRQPRSWLTVGGRHETSDRILQSASGPNTNVC